MAGADARSRSGAPRHAAVQKPAAPCEAAPRPGSIEDVDYRTPRRLDKALFQQLAACRWIAEHRNLLVTGPCGVGNHGLSCALAQKACRDGYTCITRACHACSLISNWRTVTALRTPVPHAHQGRPC